MPRRSAAPSSRTALLANDRYAVMVTTAGSGYSAWRDLAVTRWRGDATLDDRGSYVYLRDLQSGAVWSPTLQPLADNADHREAGFLDSSARFARRAGALVTTLEIAVDPQHDIEVRGIGLRNDSDEPREIELTSYVELVLDKPHADASHPAFSKMFVQTQFDAKHAALLASRRKREPSDPDIWAAHGAVIDGAKIGSLQYETDRARFIGRDRTLRAPAALDPESKLSGTVGTVLDPVFSLRVRVRVPPHSIRRIAFVTAAAATRHDAIDLIARHATPQACAKVFACAAQATPKQFDKLGIDVAQARCFQRLADALLYNDTALRAPAKILAKGEGGAPVLWAKGISGDLPIAVLRIDDASRLPIVAEMLLAQSYWRAKRLPADLVIVNDAKADAIAALQKQIEALVSKTMQGSKPDKSQGSVFVLRGDQLDDRLRNGLLTVARMVLHGANGDLQKQIARLKTIANGTALAQIADPSSRRKPGSSVLSVHRAGPQSARNHADREKNGLQAFNGLGGFDADGSEYVTQLQNGESTQMPWSQLVANPDFGFLATTTGGGYCWSLNSQQNPITPWSNDAVCDPPSEVLYLRDLDDGALWSAAASPIRVKDGEYVARFGPGYAQYETAAYGIESECRQFVPLSGTLKISRLRLRNCSGIRRRLSITAFVQWAMAPIGDDGSPFIVTSFDGATTAIFARNAWRETFDQRIAFAGLAHGAKAWTADRTEFIGRDGALSAPAALIGAKPLSGRTGAGLDPCAALQTQIELEPDASAEIVFLLGDATDADQARALIERYRTIDLDDVIAQTHTLWDDALGTVQVRTPDPHMDRLLNRCLLYQTLACRLWARTAFYQASGAYGFRDQLQDVMALCIARPDLAREHILRSAARQFLEGDVQHWWLPPSGKGVRTRVSDDRLWLPFVVVHYIETTGDRDVLDETIPFLQGDILKPGQLDAFFMPSVSDQGGTLFEHCARAIEVSLPFGAHGLPLMGTGDWNDGMNRVGVKGKGESVWLGWFLLANLQAFAPIAEARDETQRAQVWRTKAGEFSEALEKSWDGAWYRRAYYDDGTPLGSKRDTECMIDSIAQSWAVISGAAHPDHAKRAMQSVDEHLVREKDGLVALFTAPFDRTHHDPGYLKGYPPGLRENGGQYTHGSIWSMIAYALLGDGDKAHQLFRIFDPLQHTASARDVQHYKVEPYVVCADVYSVAPHIGRGGWTWYSGSAGWLYRGALEYLLGFQLRGASLRIDPSIPKAWPGFEIDFRYHSARYHIVIENPRGVCRGVSRVELDGSALKDSAAMIPLADDGNAHQIKLTLG